MFNIFTTKLYSFCNKLNKQANCNLYLFMFLLLILLTGPIDIFGQNMIDMLERCKQLDFRTDTNWLKSLGNSKLIESYNSYNPQDWSEPMLVSNLPGENYGSKAIIDSSGKIWVAWGNKQGYSEQVYISSYDGSVWATPILIDTKLNFGVKDNISLEVDVSGKVWIAWNYLDFGVGGSRGGDIGVRYYNGSIWSPKMQVPMPIEGWVNAEPDLVIDAIGNIWVIFQHRNDLPPIGVEGPEDDFDIYANYYDGTNWLATPMQVTTPNSPAWDWWVSGTLDSLGNVLATWFSNRTGNYYGYSSRYNVSTGWIPDSAIITIDGDSTRGGEYCDLTTDFMGKVWLAYNGVKTVPGIGMLPTVVVTHYSSSSWSSLQFISNEGQEPFMDLFPQISIDKNSGKIWVAWTRMESTGLSNIYLKYFDGLQWSPLIQATESGLDGLPKVVIDNSERIWVIWTSLATKNIYAKYTTYSSIPVELELEISIPNEFSLEQNYPNPFNPTTTIRYSLADDGFVKLIVYDMLGEEVTSLVNSVQKAGNHEIEFNAGSLSSGVYLYRIQAGEFVQSRKMILTK